jgi:transcriptional regulator with XRE-family HTH domain
MRQLQPTRVRRLLTQQQLADRVGVDLNSVQRWEAGLSFPRSQHLARLCQALGVQPDEIVEADEWPTRRPRSRDGSTAR